MFFFTSLIENLQAIWFQFIAIIFLLVCSALISASEVAFFSLQVKSLEDSDEDQITPGTLRIISLLKNPKRLLATILVANNFINIAIVLLFTILSKKIFIGINNPFLLLFIEIGIVTTLILIFGEILPKVYANRNAYAFSLRMAPIIQFLDRFILFWITSPMSRTTAFLEKKLGDKKNKISVDQLSQALELTDDQETTSDEQRMLEGIVNFGNTDTREVMCPRIDIFALSDQMSLKEIIPSILNKGFSRIPVYSEKKDNIRGILYTKDLLPHLGKPDYQWQKLLKTPLYVPENKKLDDLLKEFQQKKNHLAIVVDEYGGTSGLITLEDIMEEIIGDISDEFDEIDLNFSKIDESTYVFDAKISLKDFFRVINIEDSGLFDNIKGEAETLAGLVLEMTKKFPRRGQKVSFKGYKFIVEEIDQFRVKQIKVYLPEKYNLIK
ncbi:gliding motility-associated protein GldE [Bacteroidetes bacterium SCGC AAA795-G10]|nr:gliding motility-associated protein GldE [Bacteroidetes bacterium SCGC AAA795-G10]